MKQINKFLSIMLVFVIFVSLFSFSSFADSAFTYRLADFQLVGHSDTPNIFGTTNYLGKSCTYIQYDSSDDVKISSYQKVSEDFKIGTSYTLTFSVLRKGYIGGFLYLTDSLTNLDNSFPIAEFSPEDLISDKFKDYSIQVQFPDQFNGKQVYLLFIIVGNKPQQSLYITDFVFTDNNQTEEKIDGILEWLSAVYHSIVGGEDSRGVQHDGLVQGIKNGLNSLGDRIVNAFENIKISIENKIEAIGDWFNELGEKIAEGFDYIVDMILYFEYPVEKNADGVPINTDTGQPVYTNPFESVWEDIESKLNEWIAKISDFIDSMESARDNVTSYMDTGKQLIDGVISGVPILGALFIFVAGFYVIRKVVGQ